MKLDDEPEELNGKFMGSISADFVKVADNIKEASYQIRERKYSQYPIFPVSKIEIQIGTLLFKKFELDNDWYYYASMAEEFVQRGLIADTDVFEATYKNPDEYCCLFVVEEDFVNFVFIPFPEDN